MKKLILFLIFGLFFCSCAKKRTFKKNSSTYVCAIPYGFFNPEDKMDSVQYKVSIGNVVWSALLSETIVVPVVLCGWYFYEPIAMMSTTKESLEPPNDLIH